MATSEIEQQRDLLAGPSLEDLNPANLSFKEINWKEFPGGSQLWS